MSDVEPRPIPQTCQNATCRAQALRKHCPGNPYCPWRVCDICNTISSFVRSRSKAGWVPVTSIGNPAAGTAGV